ncbi:MAG: hypothetical protein OIN84_10870 [Candidatus Methanoperedens sp.]|nr:transglutaminase-like domain-containing protein [Candidatus Methanoperedens sp. BLZ2]MBZ0174445.1 hypothetical protein [Candidatus Methanoperedens nitroreducens]MCX9078465.1 hypothetical protein [Candidatus Methanoperedens sp.]
MENIIMPLGKRIENFFVCKGHKIDHATYQFFLNTKRAPVPTSEDIKEAEDLAKKLKGNSSRDTLDNIIKYQNENIAYFNERAVCLDAFIYSIIFGLLVILSLVPAVSSQTLLIIYITFLIFCQLGIIMVTVDRFRKKMKWKKEKFHLKELIQSIIEASKYGIFQKDMPVKKILDWKLAICRDYARLTASLLRNLFPDSELYFIFMHDHVVAGIKINNEINVFDPHYDNPTPPTVLKLDEWLNKKELNVDAFASKKDSTLRFYYKHNK